jgi:nucleoid DNA-binding protein
VEVTRADLIQHAYETHGIPRFECEATLEVLLDVLIAKMSESAAAGGIYTVEIRGFGTFLVRRRMSRPARNPHNGDTYVVPARWVLLWRPTLELRRLVNLRMAA